MTGIVKHYDATRHWGFLIPDGAIGREDEVFVHARELRLAGIVDLAPGERLSFDAAATDRPNRRAVNIRRLAS